MDSRHRSRIPEDSEFKTAINEFDNDISRHSKEDDEHGFEASKPNPESWSECMGVDYRFEALKPNLKFRQIMNDPSVPDDDAS